MTGCWYFTGMVCDRPPGICEGCPMYDKWQKMRGAYTMNRNVKQMKKEEDEDDD